MMRPTAMAIGLGAVLAAAAPARAATYDFLAPPETDLNRVYRLDKATGEMGACQYGVPPDVPGGKAPAKGADPGKTADAGKGSVVGVTLCYPPGEGGGAQAPSEYALVSSRHSKEGGVFRVDVRTGAMSICYVLDETVVCTPPSK